jgi:hypothetical protein
MVWRLLLIVGLAGLWAQPGGVDLTFNPTDQGYRLGEGPTHPVVALLVLPDDHARVLTDIGKGLS